MWIVDEDGDMFNMDHYSKIKYTNDNKIILIPKGIFNGDWDVFVLLGDLTEEERLTRYYDLVEQLCGVRIDG